MLALSPRRIARQLGFTLIEIIVVIACIAVLAGIIAPIAFNAIESSKISRAQADIKSIGSAIAQLYQDTGRYPIYDAIDATSPSLLALVSTNDGGNSTAYTDGAAAGWGDSFVSLPADIHALDWHLILNKKSRSATATLYEADQTKDRAWKGPYIENIGLDPWGEPYVVYVGGFWSQTEIASSGNDFSRSWVMSCGPDRLLQTNCDGTATGDTTVQGDDLGVRIK